MHAFQAKYSTFWTLKQTFRGRKIIQYLLPEHSELKLEINNRKKADRLQNLVWIKQYTSKQHIGQRRKLMKIKNTTHQSSGMQQRSMDAKRRKIAHPGSKLLS